jgi:hypothetical protein
MGQELRIDTTQWAKIHTSTEENNRGGHLPNMGQVGPAPSSPMTPLDPGFGWTAWITPQ